MAMVKSPALARGELQAKIAELKVRCFAEFPDNEMYEIGTECSAVLVRLDELLSTSPDGHRRAPGLRRPVLRDRDDPVDRADR